MGFGVGRRNAGTRYIFPELPGNVYHVPVFLAICLIPYVSVFLAFCLVVSGMTPGAALGDLCMLSSDFHFINHFDAIF